MPGPLNLILSYLSKFEDYQIWWSRTTAELGAGAPPRYTFEAWLGGAGDEAAPAEAMRWLGAATYP
jgi:hypothetical protein